MFFDIYKLHMLSYTNLYSYVGTLVVVMVIITVFEKVIEVFTGRRRKPKKPKETKRIRWKNRLKNFVLYHHN